MNTVSSPHFEINPGIGRKQEGREDEKRIPYLTLWNSVFAMEL